MRIIPFFGGGGGIGEGVSKGGWLQKKLGEVGGFLNIFQNANAAKCIDNYKADVGIGERKQAVTKHKSTWPSDKVKGTHAASMQLRKNLKTNLLYV